MQKIKKIIPAKKNIALVAHDGKKEALLKWCLKNKDVLAKHDLYGTGTTGHLIANATGLNITKLLSGPMGGDQQLGAKISEDQVHLLIFFWDPLASQPHDPDVKALLRLAAVWNIPVACTEISADMILTSPLLNEEISRMIPDHQSYINERLNS